MTSICAIVWVLVLYNALHIQQAVLPEQYPDENACKIARIKQGFDKISVLGTHGECKQAVVIEGHPLKLLKKQK